MWHKTQCQVSDIDHTEVSCYDLWPTNTVQTDSKATGSTGYTVIDLRLAHMQSLRVLEPVRSKLRIFYEFSISTPLDVSFVLSEVYNSKATYLLMNPLMNNIILTNHYPILNHRTRYACSVGINHYKALAIFTNSLYLIKLSGKDTGLLILGDFHYSAKCGLNGNLHSRFKSLQLVCISRHLQQAVVHCKLMLRPFSERSLYVNNLLWEQSQSCC